jgi:pyruvate-ferredoxin/flavodoxin oxidoreductase
MVKRVFDELRADKPRNGFTIGIHDDVSHSSLDWDPAFRTDAHADSVQALFYGLGSDGTVSANKNSIKIIGEATDLYAQGYFVYDSKKSGATTVSHLRFGPTPIRSSYLIEEGEANFIGCHQPQFLGSVEMLSRAANGAVFLVNTATAPEAFWDRLPAEMQQQAIDKQLRLFVSTPTRLPQTAVWASASTPSCRPAFLRSPGCCRGRRPSMQSRPR